MPLQPRGRVTIADCVSNGSEGILVRLRVCWVGMGDAMGFQSSTAPRIAAQSCFLSCSVTGLPLVSVSEQMQQVQRSRSALLLACSPSLCSSSTTSLKNAARSSLPFSVDMIWFNMGINCRRFSICVICIMDLSAGDVKVGCFPLFVGSVFI